MGPVEDLGALDEDLARSDMKSSPHDLASKPDLVAASKEDLGGPPSDLSDPPPTDLTPPPIYRALPTSTAHLRALALATNEVIGHKLCIYGDDDDPQPYAVVRALANSGIDDTLPPYTLVPAGIPLRAHVVDESVALWTFDCNRQKAKPLTELIGGKASLSEGRYYSAVRAGRPGTKACVSDAAHARCGFYPPTQGTAATIDCPGQGDYLIEDGKRVGEHYEAGFRVINLSDNLSDLSYGAAPGASGASSQHAFAHYRVSQAATYVPPLTEDLPILFCPWFLIDCDQTGSWTIDDGYDALIGCTDHWGTSGWLQGIGSSDRLMAQKASTLYFVGEGKGLTSNQSKLAGTVGVYVVGDVAETLP